MQRTSKSSRTPGQQHERFARMPQNQLLDALFGLFREKEFWSVKELRLKTEQPEAYLKETLGQIATLHRSGPVCFALSCFTCLFLTSFWIHSITAFGS